MSSARAALIKVPNRAGFGGVSSRVERTVFTTPQCRKLRYARSCMAPRVAGTAWSVAKASASARGSDVPGSTRPRARPRPDSASASFEQLSIEQRDFVASQKGYQRYNAQVFYKPRVVAPAKELRTSFTVGTGSAYDVDYDQVNWGSLAKPEASVLFADLRAEQQDVILEKLGYRRYEGLVWREGATSNFRVTFFQGGRAPSGGVADYTHSHTP